MPKKKSAKKESLGDKVFKKYQKELEKGPFSDQALQAIKELVGDDITDFVKRVNADKKIDRFKLNEALIKLEPPHKPDSYLIRGASVARKLFMTDNPKMDTSVLDNIFSGSVDWVKDTHKLITENQLKLLIAGKVGRDDIASVAFFNTVNASVSETITKNIFKYPEEQQKVLLAVLGVMKGEARITDSHIDTLKKNLENLREKTNKDATLSPDQREAKLKSIQEAEDKGIEYLKVLQAQIAKEHEAIHKEYDKIVPPKPKLRMQTLPEPTEQPTLNAQVQNEQNNNKKIDRIDQKVTFIKVGTKQINEKLLELTAETIEKLENDLKNPKFKDRYGEFSKNLSHAKEKLETLREKTFEEWQYGRKGNKLEDHEWIEINTKIKDLLTKCDEMKEQYDEKVSNHKPHNKFHKFIKKTIADFLPKTPAHHENTTLQKPQTPKTSNSGDVTAQQPTHTRRL